MPRAKTNFPVDAGSEGNEMTRLPLQSAPPAQCASVTTRGIIALRGRLRVPWMRFTVPMRARKDKENSTPQHEPYSKNEQTASSSTWGHQVQGPAAPASPLLAIIGSFIASKACRNQTGAWEWRR